MGFRHNAPVKTAPIVKSYGTVTTNQSVDGSTADEHLLTLGANITVTLSVALVPDRTIIRVVLTQDATGTRLVTWTNANWGTPGAPVLTAAVNKTDVIEFTFASITTPIWYGRVLSQGF